jgi:hypothetical protein
MEEMGFNKEAPVETQKAFIKHLISAATATESKIPRSPIHTGENTQVNANAYTYEKEKAHASTAKRKAQTTQQLEFNFESAKPVAKNTDDKNNLNFLDENLVENKNQNTKRVS